MVKPALSFIAGFSLALAPIAWSDFEKYKVTASQLLGGTAFAINQLHLLKIEQLDKLEQSLALDIYVRMRDLHVLEQNQKLSNEEQERLSRMRVLIAVMQEKDEIDAWQDEAEFQARLIDSSKRYPELVSKFRCYDWGQPMWIAEICE